MFLLQLSRTDAIVVEAFRTGEIESTLTEVDGILFFLYRIDGIFKDGQGDAPLSLALVKEELMCRTRRASPIRPSISISSIRSSSCPRTADGACARSAFADIIRQNVRAKKVHRFLMLAFQKKVAAVWAKKSPADLRAAASASHTLPMTLSGTVH